MHEFIFSTLTFENLPLSLRSLSIFSMGLTLRITLIPSPLSSPSPPSVPGRDPGLAVLMDTLGVDLTEAAGVDRTEAVGVVRSEAVVRGGTGGGRDGSGVSCGEGCLAPAFFDISFFFSVAELGLAWA